MCTLQRTILQSQLYDMHYTGGIQFRRNHFPVTPRHYWQKSKDRATLSWFFLNVAIKNQNWFSFLDTYHCCDFPHIARNYVLLIEGYHSHLLIVWMSFTHSIQKVRSDVTKTDKTIHTLLWRHRSNPSGIWTKRRKKWGLITRLFKYLYPTNYLLT